jgi:hypothetical protein
MNNKHYIGGSETAMALEELLNPSPAQKKKVSKMMHAFYSKMKAAMTIEDRRVRRSLLQLIYVSAKNDLYSGRHLWNNDMTPQHMATLMKDRHTDALGLSR